ncbi:MAG: ATP-binding protein [Rhodothermales bacterium]
MAWSDLIDQQRATETLRRVVAGERVPHAFLFYGRDGVGKRAAALELAKTLQCERGTGEACGRCLACTKVGRLLHPDVHVLLPAPKDVDTDDLRARLETLAKNPYATVDFVRRPSLDDPAKTSNKQAFYPVARINDELRRAMSYRPVEGRYKVAIMTDADLLRTEAANAFLKLLEEPAPQTVFILITSRPDRLLPTILSRCQRFRFDVLPAEAIEAALVEREGARPDVAGTLARMADGSYSRALDLAQNEDLLADRQMVLNYFRMAYTGGGPQHAAKLADAVEEMARLGRERLKSLLDLMLRWMRDLALYRVLGDEAPLVNVDQREAVERFCKNVPDADLEAMARLVEDAIELAERNVQLPLTLIVLADALGRAMRGQAPEHLYTPLAEPYEMAS